MPHEAELGFLAWSFAIEPRLRIGSRGVGIVRALLAVKIHLPVPSASVRGRFVRAILRFEALHRRPGFDQRAVDREMVGAQKPLHARLLKNCAQQLGRDECSRVACGRYG
jgi:hypothetical protein